MLGAGRTHCHGRLCSDRAIFSGNAAYAATKFGARAMHEVLREETRGTGVRATLVSPSAVDTGIWDSVTFADGSSPDRSAMLHASSVADAVLFAVSRPANVNIDELRLSDTWMFIEPYRPAALPREHDKAGW